MVDIPLGPLGLAGAASGLRHAIQLPGERPVGAPSGAVATWTVDSTGPITMGFVAPKGMIPNGSALQVGSFTTGTTVSTRYADNSAWICWVSFNATSTGDFDLTVITDPGGTYTPTWPSASVAFDVSGTVYTATLPSFDGTDSSINNAVCRRARKLVRPLDGATPLAEVDVIFEVTSYNGVSGHEVSVVIQQTRDTTSVAKVTADLTTTIDGSGFSTMTKSGYKIHTGQRHHRKTTCGGLTNAVVKHDFEPWIAAKMIPRIPNTVNARTYNFATVAYEFGVDTVTADGLRFGEATASLGDSENADRQEINPFTDWEARLFALNTAHYREAVLRNADQSGEWSINLGKSTDSLQPRWPTTDPNVYTHDPASFDDISWPPAGNNTLWTGAFWGANAPGTIGYDAEHTNETCFVAYLITGDTIYLDNLRLLACWANHCKEGGYILVGDQAHWPGFRRNKNGTAGLMMDNGITREFGRPFKQVSRAAVATPDSYADKDDIITIIQNNLNKIEEYIQLIDAQAWPNYTTWTKWVGMWPHESAWYLSRSNSVVSSIAGSPTILEVIGDDSGVGTGINDHGMQTGDTVTLASTGISALNGDRVITRIDATHFSVPVNTTSLGTVTGGTWSHYTSIKLPPWRVVTGAWPVAWALRFTDLWTATADMWAFPERCAHNHVALQDYPSFDTLPGNAYNYYPTPYHIQGGTYQFYSNWTDFHEANQKNSPTGGLFLSESYYASAFSNGSFEFDTHHRGSIAYHIPNPNTYYTPYANAILAVGAERGVTGAAAALARNVAASGVLNELKRRPGYYHTAWE